MFGQFLTVHTCVAPGGLLTTRRSAVWSDCQRTLGQVSCQLAPDAAGPVVDHQIARQALSCSPNRLIGIHLLVFDTFPESLTNTLSRQQPFPSMLILNPLVFQAPCELLAGELTPLVGVEDLRQPYCVIACRTASRQKSVVNVLESRQASTWRLAQPSTAQRYTKPRRIGIEVISSAQT